MHFQLIKFDWFFRLFGKKKPCLQQGNIQHSEIVKQEVIPEDQTKTVLSRIINDEAMIVRLIKQDIVTNIILRNSNNQLDDIGSKIELNSIIYDLLLLDKSKNKDEIIEFYDKMVEDSSTMFLEFPTMSLEELALNCYIEVIQLRKW
ncbi:MAG: hypothetical protein A3D31_17570 [Candidatus Fluviicola riflensis]|nr:MAG: hypothetical protein CHH17_02510 [Candidatus Fluviicola riflensis]OGS76794.1 MAG: hypothetical protein A3D31_17570 [Candidatus Fluviicola riflensis]OGS82851.1 MAG: hypothetical protein A2724_13790 [Fluviicola sp. RIFCSPHIGHO2_01_FULL_43_53]OGS88524.1 MAG: hypothetical protein A3E30_07075 [Fluviicola sp. RIFCSPHIGHO2_12_FULL_43_24]